MRTTWMTLAVTLAVAATAAVAGAPTAAAASGGSGAPVISTVTVEETVPDVNFACATYGYDFDALATFTVTRRSISFFDAAGNLVLERRHVDFSGTLYRSDDLSKTIPYEGKWTRTFDVAANTVTTSGLVRYSHPDGSGMVSLAPGHVVVDASTFDPIKEAGISGQAWEAGVCSYLSAA